MIRETERFLLLSILIGISAGLLVVCFRISIDFVSWLLVGVPAGRNAIGTLLSPVLGASIAGLLVLTAFRTAQGSGVNQTKTALYIRDGYIPFSTVVGKFLSCTVSIGSGNSLGPEDPSLQMGAGLASLLGRMFRLSRDSMRLITPVGAAAGIAAAFNTPIAAVLFVLEVVVGGWNTGVLGSVVLSSVSAVVTARWFLGNEPLFGVPDFRLSHSSELVFYALIGLAGGMIAALFTALVDGLRRRLRNLPAWTQFALPGLAGAAVGTASLFLPQVMGAGYQGIDSALHDQFPWDTLLLLALVKFVVTLFCFCAGTPGGMFAPTLFVGAMLGGAVGALARLYSPFPASVAGAYVLAGMGTFFAGVFRAPMTSIFMVYELSASYVIILPVMLANAAAYLVSRRLQPKPFFDVVASEEGLELPSVEEQQEMAQLRVEDAMQPADSPLSPELTVADAEAAFGQPALGLRLVPRGRGLWSAVTRAELEELGRNGKAELPLREALPLDLLPRLYPDLGLDSAMREFGQCTVVPVTSRERLDQLLGVITLADVHRAYGIAQPSPESNAGSGATPEAARRRDRWSKAEEER